MTKAAADTSDMNEYSVPSEIAPLARRTRMKEN
jgi:hypothetical protein